MKKHIFLLLIAITILTTITVYAHPGRTDSDGGHTNHSTGEYHYHHSYPEHQHLNGTCPYDNDNNNNVSYSDNAENIESNKKSNARYKSIFSIILAGVIFLYLIHWGNKKE